MSSWEQEVLCSLGGMGLAACWMCCKTICRMRFKTIARPCNAAWQSGGRVGHVGGWGNIWVKHQGSCRRDPLVFAKYTKQMCNFGWAERYKRGVDCMYTIVLYITHLHITWQIFYYPSVRYDLWWNQGLNISMYLVWLKFCNHRWLC